FVQLTVLYTVRDQFGDAMVDSPPERPPFSICWDETVFLCSSTVPLGSHAKGDVPIDSSAQVTDNLNMTFPGGLPASFCFIFNQSITAGGCGPLAQNTIVMQQTGVTLNPGNACAVGAPCP